MEINKISISLLINQLIDAGIMKNSELNISGLPESVRASGAFCIVKWKSNIRKKALYGSYLFSINGKDIHMSVLIDDNDSISEIEFWSPDGCEMISIPSIEDLVKKF